MMESWRWNEQNKRVWGVMKNIELNLTTWTDKF
jgi:hypothetical protein